MGFIDDKNSLVKQISLFEVLDDLPENKLVSNIDSVKSKSFKPALEPSSLFLPCFFSTTSDNLSFVILSKLLFTMKITLSFEIFLKLLTNIFNLSSNPLSSTPFSITTLKKSLKKKI